MDNQIQFAGIPVMTIQAGRRIKPGELVQGTCGKGEKYLRSGGTFALVFMDDGNYYSGSY